MIFIYKENSLVINQRNISFFTYFIMMKRIFIITLLLGLTSVLFAQKKFAKTCSACGGAGGFWAGDFYTPCYCCGATGVVFNTGPEVMKAAENYGACLATLSMGKSNLANGDYTKALKNFSDALSKYDSSEAIIYIGYMAELGMGTKIDKNLAWNCYKLAADAGLSEAKEALQRIQTDGYWEPTEQNRKAFRQILAAQIGTTTAPSNGNYYNGNSGGSSSSSYSNGRTCAGCSGTGRCTMCKGAGGYWINDVGMYTGENIKEWTTCPACHGSGQCQVCYGKGFIRY